MIFNSGFFLLLFTGFLFLFYLIQKNQRAKLIFVTIFSYYFYYKSSGIYFLVLMSVTIVDYRLAEMISRAVIHRKKKLLLIASLLINLGTLAYFKYTNFLTDIFSGLTGDADRNFDIFLPVGISFFTFQSLSYTIDIYRGNLKPAPSFWITPSTSPSFLSWLPDLLFALQISCLRSGKRLWLPEKCLELVFS